MLFVKPRSVKRGQLTLPERSVGFTGVQRKRDVINAAARTVARSMNLAHTENLSSVLPYGLSPLLQDHGARVLRYGTSCRAQAQLVSHTDFSTGRSGLAGGRAGSWGGGLSRNSPQS